MNCILRVLLPIQQGQKLGGIEKANKVTSEEIRNLFLEANSKAVESVGRRRDNGGKES